MKRVIYLFVVAALAVGFASCNEHDLDADEQDLNTIETGLTTFEADLDLRAATLGYSDAASYEASVAEQCAAGNHENCDILDDGTHQACAYAEHSGTHHNGSHHDGRDHGTHHNANGHSHGSHGSGKHH